MCRRHRIRRDFHFDSRSRNGRAYRRVCSHSLDRQPGFRVARPELKEKPTIEYFRTEKHLRESNWLSSWAPCTIGRRRTTTRSFTRAAAGNAHDHFALFIEKR